MDFFNKVSDVVVKTGKTIGQKATDAASVTKLSYQIHTKEEELKDKYAKVGQKYFEASGNQPDSSYEEDFDEIRALKDQIADLKEQVRVTKGVDACPKCGAEVQKGARFCPSCGAELTPFEDED